MPEYLALVHHHNLTTSDELEDIGVEDVERGMKAMHRAGIGSIH